MNTLLILKNNKMKNLLRENTQKDTVIYECQDEEDQAALLLRFLEENHFRVKNSSLEDSFKEESSAEPGIIQPGIILAQGRGLSGKEGALLLEQLAGHLHAQIVCTRPCIDRGWQPDERMVGKAGRTVHARLYMSFGVSGSIQHIGGVDADCMIAVNNNLNAQIFRRCDFGICGDAKKVLHAMLKILG